MAVGSPRISSLFIAGVLVSLVITVTTGIGLWFLYQDYRDAVMRERFASAVVTAAFQLTSLTGDYMLYRETRARDQWIRKHETLGKLLRNPGFQRTIKDHEIPRLRRDHAKAQKLFGRISESFMKNRQGGQGMKSAIAREKRLVDTLLTVMQALASHASLNSTRNRLALGASSERVGWLIAVYLLVLTALVLSFWLVLARRVMAPIQDLKKGIDAFGKGNLDHRLRPRHTDEIGEVAVAFNEMAGKLQESMVSRERAIVSKTRFLAAASHDLRQPMQAITSLNYMLKNKLRDEDVLPLVQRLESNSNVVVGLLNELLDISKLDAGVMEPDIQAVALNDVLRNIESGFSDVAQEKGIAFRVMPSKTIVSSDPILLGRILQNLLANAFRYTDEGKVLVGCRRHGANLRIDVCDTGQGIPESHLDQIFDEFYQVGNPARNRREGMGLGLAIVQRLVRLLNYTLEVSSFPGKGSRFSVLIPLGNEMSHSSNGVS